jgi:transcriptional regulator with XRE-family HTH domain
MTAAELARARARLRLNRTRFARAFDVDRRTVHRWERGLTPIPRQVAVLVRAAGKYASVRAELGIHDSAAQKLKALLAVPGRPAHG